MAESLPSNKIPIVWVFLSENDPLYSPVLTLHDPRFEETKRSEMPEDRLIDFPTQVLEYLAKSECLDGLLAKPFGLSWGNLSEPTQATKHQLDDPNSFARAVFAGSLSALDRHASQDAAPRNFRVNLVRLQKYETLKEDIITLWEAGSYTMIRTALRGFEGGCLCTDSEDKDQNDGEDREVHLPFSRCLDTVKWLLKHGDDPNAPIDTEKGVRRTATEYLLLTLLARHDRKKVDFLCQLIHTLVEHGAALPSWTLKARPNDPSTNDDEGLMLDGSYYDRNPVAIAMMLHCPPLLLELVLQTYQREEFDMKSRYDTSQLDGERNRERNHDLLPRMKTNLDGLLRNIHSHLFRPKGDWKEAYHGEVADMLAEKVKLLVKYQAVDDTEEELLNGVVSGVRAAYAIGKDLGWEIERSGKRCWDALFSGLDNFIYPKQRTPEAKAFEARYERHHEFRLSRFAPWRKALCKRIPKEARVWDPETEWHYSVGWWSYWEQQRVTYGEWCLKIRLDLMDMFLGEGECRCSFCHPNSCSCHKCDGYLLCPWDEYTAPWSFNGGRYVEDDEEDDEHDLDVHHRWLYESDDESDLSSEIDESDFRVIVGDIIDSSIAKMRMPEGDIFDSEIASNMTPRLVMPKAIAKAKARSTARRRARTEAAKKAKTEAAKKCETKSERTTATTTTPKETKPRNEVKKARKKPCKSKKMRKGK